MKIRNSVLSIAIALSSIGLLAQAPRPQSTPAAASAPTAIPALVPYSGIALSGEGKPLGSEINMTFLIYKDERGGEPLWSESQVAAVDSTGHYKVQLGATYPSGLPSDLFATGEARWLEIQTAGQPEQPRVLLASVPYALKAADAATLGGLPASAFALAGTGNSTNAALAAAITPDAATTVTTTGGTANKVAKFSGANTIVNSLIYDNGTDVGIGTTTPNATLTVDGTMTVDGASTLNGAVTLPATGTATASAKYNSQLTKIYTSAYNSSTKAVVSPRFEWQAEPTNNDTAAPSGTLNLLSSTTSAGATETGFFINANGTIHFATGQAFPGTGTGNGTITGVTAGTGLTGGGTSGNVTLNLNTATSPTLAGNNTYTGSNVFVPSMYEDLDVNIDNNNTNAGNVSPGLRLGQASGEGMSSKRTSGGNQYGVDIYTGYQARLSINSAGLVGIGTTAPGAKLEVNGTLKLTSGSGGGIIFADGTTQGTAFVPANCGADYAESVGVSGGRTNYEPGDILVIDPAAPGKFLKSNQPYSTMVAGIYSTQPGFVGRLHPADATTDATEVPMAMVGRVPTKVSAENGPIQAGDLLVSSSKLGYAMKGTDRSQMLGAVVGKALGSLDSGTGVIMALVTLQ